MVPLIRKILRLFAIPFITLTLMGTVLITPANAIPGTESSNWKLVEAFGNAMRELQARNQEFWWVYAALVLLLAGFIVYQYRVQKRINSTRLSFVDVGTGDNTKRNLMRLSVDQELFYARVQDNSYRRSKVINMSGGGLLFATGEEYQLNDELKIVMELFPGEIVRLRARVVRITKKSGDNDEGPYMLGLQFKNISKGEQDSIVKRILQEQQGSAIEERRKSKNECIFCGEPIPDKARGIKLYCPKCSDYELDSIKKQEF